MRPLTENALQNILDTMTGADGGVSFVCLKSFLIDFDKRAENGDKAAAQIMDIVVRFSKIIDVANKEVK